MKRIISASVTLLMLIVFTGSAMGSTIGVEVTPGFSLDLSKQIDPSEDPYTITGYYGINEQLIFSLSYYNSDPDSVNTLGLRYSFTKNFAFTADYLSQKDYNSTTIGIRYRAVLNEKLDIVGELDYTTDKDTSETDLITQAEYKLTDFFTINGGIKYYSPSGEDSNTNFILGGEFYPDDHWCPYFDYEIVNQSGEKNLLTVGITYSF